MGGLAAVLAGSLCFVLLTKRVPFSSDQAVVGLMARDILAGVEHPIFYYGSTYAGTLESHILAVAFAVFGPTTTVYRGVMAVFVCLTAAGVFATTRRFFGRGASAIAGAYLALPPFFFVYRGLTSDGAYASAALVSVGVVAGALWQDERTRTGGRTAAPLAVLGFAAGVGFWVTPATLPVSAAALLWLVMGRTLAPLLRSVAILAAGAALGASPSLAWNATHEWASFTSREMGLHDPTALFRNLLTTATSTFAIVVGAARPLWTVDPGAPFPGAWPLVGLVLLMVLGIAFLEARRDRRVQLLLLVFALVLVAVSASHRFTPREPRLLVTLYAVLPPLLGISLWRVFQMTGRASRVAPAALALLLITNAGSLVKARVFDVDPITDLPEMVESAGVDRLYSRYGEAYYMAFHSRERILATPLSADDCVRIPRYERAVQAAASPGIALVSPEARCFETYLKERNSPFEVRWSDRMALFTKLPDETVELLRRARTLPLPSTGHKSTWSVLRHPDRLVEGAEALVAFEIRNDSPCDWTPAVHVGHWWRQNGKPAIEVPGRFFPDRLVRPGDSFRAEFTIRAPEAPGPWSVGYDLVQESVAWFGNEGGNPTVLPVHVEPSTRR